MSGSGGKTLNRCGAKLSIVFTPSRDGRDKACDARQAVDTLETSEASADPSQERSGQDRSEPGHAEQDACVLVSAKALGDLLVEGGECLVDPLDLGYEQCTDPLGSKDSALFIFRSPTTGQRIVHRSARLQGQCSGHEQRRWRVRPHARCFVPPCLQPGKKPLCAYSSQRFRGPVAREQDEGRLGLRVVESSFKRWEVLEKRGS